jgi:hypothetical protein
MGKALSIYVLAFVISPFDCKNIELIQNNQLPMDANTFSMLASYFCVGTSLGMNTV